VRLNEFLQRDHIIDQAIDVILDAGRLCYLLKRSLRQCDMRWAAAALIEGVTDELSVQSNPCAEAQGFL
jgi:hypothetical protein